MKISKLKKFYSFCSAVLVAVLFSMPVFAADQKDTSGEIHQSQVIMTNKYGTEVEIDFANSDTGATYNIVQSIIDSNPQETKFTIYEVGDSEAGLDTYPNKSEASTREWNPPFGSTHKYQTEKTPAGSEKVVKDDFVISVARGQTITLSRKYIGTLSSSISGEYFNKANLGIKSSISCEYSTTYKFQGPANANSREYRVKYFQQDGKYIQKDYCYKADGSLYGVRSHGGTYQEATRYASYSIDKNY